MDKNVYTPVLFDRLEIIGSGGICLTECYMKKNQNIIVLNRIKNT